MSVTQSNSGYVGGQILDKTLEAESKTYLSHIYIPRQGSLLIGNQAWLYSGMRSLPLPLYLGGRVFDTSETLCRKSTLTTKSGALVWILRVMG